MSIQLLICNPTKIIFNDLVEDIRLPGVEGSFQVLPSHAPLISLLTEGQVVSNTQKGIETFPIQGGFVEVGDNKVNVLLP